MINRAALKRAVLFMMLVVDVSAQPVEGSSDVIGSFRDELTLPVRYNTLGNLGSGFNGGLEYNRYFSQRVHDLYHRSLFAEYVTGPTSSFHASIAYQANPVFDVPTRGYTLSAGGVSMMGDIGLGVWGRFSRHDIQLRKVYSNDYEFGPQFSLWLGPRIYLNDKILYRKIGEFSDDNVGTISNEEDFLQVRHHLTYIAGENYDVTYTQEIDARVGIHQNLHTNAFSIYHYLMFSPSTSFSFGPMLGVDLDYFVGRRTSVLTLPVRARIEYFLKNLSMINAEIGYDTPTMEGRGTGSLSMRASYSFRF